MGNIKGIQKVPCIQGIMHTGLVDITPAFYNTHELASKQDNDDTRNGHVQLLWKNYLITLHDIFKLFFKMD